MATQAYMPPTVTPRIPEELRAQADWILNDAQVSRKGTEEMFQRQQIKRGAHSFDVKSEEGQKAFNQAIIDEFKAKQAMLSIKKPKTEGLKSLGQLTYLTAKEPEMLFKAFLNPETEEEERNSIVLRHIDAGNDIDLGNKKEVDKVVSQYKEEERNRIILEYIEAGNEVNLDNQEEIDSIVAMEKEERNKVIKGYVENGQLRDPTNKDEVNKALVKYFQSMASRESGEVLIQNPNESNLASNLEEFSKKFNELNFKDPTNKEIAILVHNHIKETFPYNPQELLTTREGWLKGNFIHLGEFIRHESGVCRHRAALGVNMGQVINELRNDIQIVPIYDEALNHTWNQLMFDNGKSNQEIYIIDTLDLKGPLKLKKKTRNSKQQGI